MLAPRLLSSEISLCSISSICLEGPLWQRLFLDVVILAVSLYGYYAFRGQQEDIIQTVVSGKAMDPLLFLSSGLFILGASLVCLRLQPLLVRIIYFIGKRRWKPAGYASFLEILRTGKKQYFIMTFLMLTVSLGIFNTTVARTILANAEANQKYNVGADIVLQEKWRSNEEQVRLGTEQTLIYKEPDFDRYGQIEGVKSAAKVYINKEITLPREKMAVMMTSTPQLYAIHSKNFGTTTSLPDDIMSEHYYTILNKLGANPDAVLLSSAFRDILGLKVGDTFVYRGKDAAGRSYPDISAKIAGFFEYFPSFHKQYAWVGADGNLTVHPGYLIAVCTLKKRITLNIRKLHVDILKAGICNLIFLRKTVQAIRRIHIQPDLVRRDFPLSLNGGKIDVFQSAFHCVRGGDRHTGLPDVRADDPDRVFRCGSGASDAADYAVVGYDSAVRHHWHNAGYLPYNSGKAGI